MFPIVTVVIILINIVVYFGVEKGGFSDARQPQGARRVLVHPLRAVAHRIRSARRSASKIGCGSQTRQLRRDDGRDRTRNQPSVFLTIFTAMFMHGEPAAHRRQHAVPVDLREQRRGLDGQAEVHPLLPARAGSPPPLAQFASAHESRWSRPSGRAGPSRRCSAATRCCIPRARVVTLIFIIFFVTADRGCRRCSCSGVWFLLQLLDAGSQPVGGGGVAVLRAHRRLRVRTAHHQAVRVELRPRPMTAHSRLPVY